MTYFQTTSSLDQLADIVSENGGHFPRSKPQAPGKLPARGAGPGSAFHHPVFTVFFNAQGETLSTDVGSIASVTQEEAAGMGKEALEKAAPGAG